MFTVCPSCGEHDRETRVADSAFVCRSCGERTPFLSHFVLGASGSGKTTTGDAARAENTRNERIALVDTTATDVHDVAARVRAWLREEA